MAKKIAVISPSFAAPQYGPEVHAQAMRRLREISGMEIIETPTTRDMTSSPQARAADINAVFADPEVAFIMATLGGSDQITVVPHLDEEVICANPKPFMGYSDNTHLLNWLWWRGIQGYYGGSTQVHLGAGPKVDAEHLRALQAVLRGENGVEITLPENSEDYGRDWKEPEALTEFGQRYATPPLQWDGSDQPVSGRTWGGCVEVLMDILMAGRIGPDQRLDGSVLLLETAEGLIDPHLYGSFLRALGERGLLQRFAAAIFANPPTSSFTCNPPLEARASYRRDLRDLSMGVMAEYAPGIPVVYGVTFGHTRPQWILPYGGKIHLDPRQRTIHADYAFA